MTKRSKSNESNKEEFGEILLNIMFTGSYLENNNIGHEAINLFKADNGKNYIYVLPYGTMSNIHNGKIKTILLIRRHSAKVLEILAKAEGLEQVAKVMTTRKKEISALRDAQNKYISDNNVTYDGVRINDIFGDNKNSDEQSVFITFSAKKVTKAKQPIYLVVDSAEKKQDEEFYEVLTEIYKFSSQSPKMYISEKEHSKAYKKLEEIIKNTDYWGETTQKLIYHHKLRGEISDSYNMIDIMKKDHDELCYSNLFQHFFSINPKVFVKFVKEITKENGLSIPDFSENYKVLREWKNIDILIDDEENENVVVIENKIKSGINGVEDKHNFGSNLVQSQLKKYYECIMGSNNKEDKDEYKLGDIEDKEDNKYKKYNGKYFFIFAPDYNRINIENYECSDHYKLIEYSKIFNFFYENKEEFKGVPYFNEFLYALQKHTKPVDNSNEEEMLKRFRLKIKVKKPAQ